MQNTVEGRCPNQCSNRGVCGLEGEMEGKCLCQPNWEGADCSKRTRAVLKQLQDKCLAICKPEHGICKEGMCVCDPGWDGEDCLTPTCPSLCTVGPGGETNGDCVDGRCICQPGFGGEACSVVCPNRCSGHGTCQRFSTSGQESYRCFCEPGYIGPCGACALACGTPAARSVRLPSGSAHTRTNRRTTARFTAEDCSLTATLAEAVAVDSGESRLVGMRHKDQGLLTSSIVLIAIGTFVIGICAIPLVKAFFDKRDEQKRLQIMEQQSSLESLLNIPLARDMPNRPMAMGQ